MVGAPRQTVYRWRGVLEREEIDALREMSKGGRPAQLGAEELSRLQVVLLEGPTAYGFGTLPWTLKRVRLFIEWQFGGHYSEVHAWRVLGQLGFSSQKPDRRALERNETAIECWKKRTWPRLYNFARQEIVRLLFRGFDDFFIGESRSNGVVKYRYGF